MYNASNDFHIAVADGHKQKAMLIFSDAVFTDVDIDIDRGIEFNEYFNTEEDLAIGQMLSNEINFALFNDYGDLNDYAFGQFTALLGVQLSTTTYEKEGNCVAMYGNDTYVGRSTSPYITKNGTALANQPSWAVQSILLYNDDVYAFGSNGQCRRWVNGSGANYTLNAFMTRKVKTWKGRGFRYRSSNHRLWEWNNGTEYRYEFVPLGVFEAERPNVPDVIRIEFTCNDLMMKFEEDMPTATDLAVTYPTSVGNLLTKLCAYFHVSYDPVSFINSDATIAEEPEEFANSTARTVLGWIAEAACANARMNRDGKLILDWVHNTGQEMDEHGYVSFAPYWYNTTTVTQIVNKSNGEEGDQTCGSTDTVKYLIQDNPILRGFS